MIIPSTIQDVIMARVDILPEETKGVLQAGSVVGREFTRRGSLWVDHVAIDNPALEIAFAAITDKRDNAAFATGFVHF